MSIQQAWLNRTDERTISALASVEFGSFILIAKYLDGLDVFLDGQEQSFDSEVMILKEKMCCLCKSILQKKAILGLRADNRNDLLHKVSSWIPGNEVSVTYSLYWELSS